MRQFDVIENPNPLTQVHSPFLVVLQSHHLDPLETVLLAPLVRDAQTRVDLLHISIDVADETFLLVIPEAAGVPRTGFGKVVGSAAAHEDAIRRAFERLLTGF